MKTSIDPVVQDLATILRCLSCGRTSFTVTADDLTCACGAVVPVVDGVPHVRAAVEDVAIVKEREAVRQMEEAPLLRPTDFTLASLLADTGGLRDAFVSLPYATESAFFTDNDYFRNVARFSDVFDYVMTQLGPSTGGRLLDVGADLTWSTARLAAAGWHAVGIDINEHLRASRVLRARGPAYAVVNVDMHLPAFAEGTFEVVTAFNALHHTHRLEPLIDTLTGALRPGGRLGVVEPYWHLTAVRDAFGVDQIEAGINENIYRLEEWHRIFVQAGLELVSWMTSHSFNAVYQKRTDDVRRSLSLAEAEAELFGAFYRGAVTGPPALPGPVPAGATVEIPVRVVNGSPAGWSSEGQLPVFLSYHLYRIDDSGRVLVSYENPRTSLGTWLAPGALRDVRVPVLLPAAAGDYEIEIELVHEARSWFSSHGVGPWITRLAVTAS